MKTETHFYSSIFEQKIVSNLIKFNSSGEIIETKRRGSGTKVKLRVISIELNKSLDEDADFKVVFEIL